MNTIKFTFVVCLIGLSVGLLGEYIAYGQTVKDSINEDQVIICVSGHIVELSGNICKVFNVDDQSLLNAQEDLYKNPQQDTFDMGVVD